MYVEARAGVEPTTLRLKAIDSTNAPPRPTLLESKDSKMSNMDPKMWRDISKPVACRRILDIALDAKLPETGFDLAIIQFINCLRMCVNL